MQELLIPISIAAEDFEAMYRGDVREVVARSLDGRTVRFPARHLQRFVTRHGIDGLFRLRISADNRLEAIEKIDGR